MKFTLVASNNTPKEGAMSFLSTQSIPEFLKEYADAGEKLRVIKSDKSKHPGNIFFSFKSGGQTFNGSISHKLMSSADFAGKNLVVSICKSEGYDGLTLLLHEEATQVEANTECLLG